MFRLFTICLIIVASSAELNSQQKLNVAIYYEALCPDSVNFFTNQFWPNYESLKDSIQLAFIPFGKSKVNLENGFDCQHGPAECFLNKIQSCALYDLAGQQDAQALYASCAMHPRAQFPGQDCVDQSGLDWNTIMECSQGKLGVQLQNEALKLTGAIAPKFVPTIVYNNVFDQDLQDRSLREFSKVVCELTGNSAIACLNNY